MRVALVSAAVLLVLLAVPALLAVNANDDAAAAASGASQSTTAPPTAPSGRQPRTLRVLKDGLPYEFKLTRTIELISPLLALQRKIEDKFRDARYKKFFTPTGTPVTKDADLKDDEYVVVQKEGDMWYWPSIDMGHRVEFTLDEGRKVNITTLHMFPRVYEVTNFASAEECEHLITQSKEKGKLVESYVALHTDNDMQKNESRTSKNVNFGLEGFYLRTDPIFEKLMKRAEKLAQIPSDNLDPQVVHYDVGEFFNAHYDWLKINDTKKPQRVLTILLYLNDVEGGGDTIFPATSPAYMAEATRKYDESLCTADYDFLRHAPQRGTAVMFYNLIETNHMMNVVDPMTIHAGCPVTAGEKWAVNYWFYNREIDTEADIMPPEHGNQITMDASV